MTRRPIDYAGLASAALARIDELLSRWLPNGVERNGRWYVGDFDGGAGESANVNMRTGQWIDNAAPDEDVGNDLISLKRRVFNLAGNHEAALALMDELGWAPLDAPADAGPRHPVGVATSVQASALGAAADGSAAAGPAAADAGGVTAPGAPVPQPRGKPERWRPVVPVPRHAPPPKFVWGYKDKHADRWVDLTAVRHWAYEFEGELFGYVARFERVNSDGELVKDTLPLTWCQDMEDPRGACRWHWKQWTDPRPLYVPAGLLSADLSLPVVIVEGEKCAEAGHQLLGHEFDFVSWPGGCKAWSKARWSLLMGRTVYLWPDCDAKRQRLTRAEADAGVLATSKPLLAPERQPGMAAMVGIGSVLVADHGCTVHLCRIPAPSAVADGWDLADAIAQGWDAARVRDFIRAAGAFVPPEPEAVAKAAPTPSIAGAGSGDDGAGEAAGWRDKLLRDSKGAVRPVRENAVLALDGMALPDGRWLPGAPEAAGVIAYNAFTNDVVKLKPAPWGTGGGKWLEVDELEAGNWLSRQLWLPPMSRQTLEESVAMVARRHHYHPVREMLDGVRGTWDGQPRLATWLQRVCRRDQALLPDDDALGQYLARVGTWMLMAICARVLTPGVKFDYMPIFEGKQGWRKSTIAAILGGDWFADTGLVLGDKDSYQNLQGILVYEWGELDSLTKADVRKVKQFISSQKDRFRASFDRRAQDYPRQVVFIGTTNEHHYLSDPTGNRRFWPIRLTAPADTAWLREQLPQLYAEALAYLERGDRFHPTTGEQAKLFDPQQNERTVDDTLESGIRRYLYDEDQRVSPSGLNGSLIDRISLGDLLTALGISVDKQTDVIAKKASAVLGRLGWERKRGPAGEDSKRPWVYVRPKRSAPPTPPPPAPPADAGDAGQDQPPTQGDDTGGADSACPF